MKKIIFVSLTVILCSCASILNAPWTSVTIHTTKPTKIVSGKDTLKTHNNRLRITRERSEDPLDFVFISDSISKKISIPARNSAAYYLNIPFSYGLGMFVDNENPEKYTYPSHIYVNMSDTTSNYRYFDFGKNKGRIQAHISLPHINSFLLHPKEENNRTSTGFWGFSAGVDYFHKNNQYLSLTASAVTDIFVPVPAAVDIWGEWESMSSIYLSMTNNHKFNRLSVGYGLSYARNWWHWNVNNWGPEENYKPSREAVTKRSDAIGLCFNSYYQLTSNFYMGLIYRPTFIQFNTNTVFMYEHLFSIDFAFKIPIKK